MTYLRLLVPLIFAILPALLSIQSHAQPVGTTAATERTNATNFAFDPLTSYIVCVATGYAELASAVKTDLEAYARSRMACHNFRLVLAMELKLPPGAETDKLLLEIDVEILRSLRN